MSADQNQYRHIDISKVVNHTGVLLCHHAARCVYQALHIGVPSWLDIIIFLERRETLALQRSGRALAAEIPFVSDRIVAEAGPAADDQHGRYALGILELKLERHYTAQRMSADYRLVDTACIQNCCNVVNRVVDRI